MKGSKLQRNRSTWELCEPLRSGDWLFNPYVLRLRPDIPGAQYRFAFWYARREAQLVEVHAWLNLKWIPTRIEAQQAYQRASKQTKSKWRPTSCLLTARDGDNHGVPWFLHCSWSVWNQGFSNFPGLTITQLGIQHRPFSFMLAQLGHFLYEIQWAEHTQRKALACTVIWEHFESHSGLAVV